MSEVNYDVLDAPLPVCVGPTGEQVDGKWNLTYSGLVVSFAPGTDALQFREPDEYTLAFLDACRAAGHHLEPYDPQEALLDELRRECALLLGPVGVSVISNDELVAFSVQFIDENGQPTRRDIAPAEAERCVRLVLETPFARPIEPVYDYDLSAQDENAA